MRRILLVSSNYYLRQLFSRTFKSPDYEILLADAALEAVQMAAQLLLDLVVWERPNAPVDVKAFSGELRARTKRPWLPIVMLSSVERLDEQIEALRSGVDMSMNKPFEGEELLAVVEALLTQTDRLLARFLTVYSRDESHPLLAREPVVSPSFNAHLTLREQQVLVQVAQGHSNKAIARTLSLSRRTIEAYITSLFNKTGMTNRTELTRWAMENHHIALPSRRGP